MVLRQPARSRHPKDITPACVRRRECTPQSDVPYPERVAGMPVRIIERPEYFETMGRNDWRRPLLREPQPGRPLPVDAMNALASSRPLWTSAVGVIVSSSALI